MKVYRIRHKNTGLHSKGGCNVTNLSCHWSKKGKIWTGMGPLKLHLRQYVTDHAYSKQYENRIPPEWMVVEVMNGDWVEVQSARSLYPETKYTL